MNQIPQQKRLCRIIFRAFVCLLTYSCATIGATAQPDIRPVQSASVDEQQRLLDRLASDPDDIETLMELCSVLTMRTQPHSVIGYATRLKNIGETRHIDKARLYGYMYLGQSYMASSVNDSVTYYLDRALELAMKLDDVRALASIYNAKGIYAVDVETDYYTGMSNFMNSLKMAEKSPHDQSYPVALSNIAMLHYLRNDPSGLKYALEAYTMGQDLDNEFLRFVGAFVSAYMYHLTGNNDLAIRYIEEIVDLADKYNSRNHIYNLYANILLARGEEQKAVHYYKEALEYPEETDAASIAMAHLSYGTYLIQKGRNREAIDILTKGIEIAESRNNSRYRYKLHLRMSEALDNIGDKDSALYYYRIYHAQSDSIFNIERESSINELRVRYESERQEREIQEKEVQLLREERTIQYMIFGLTIVLLVSVALYLLYLRKNKRYKQIVIQQKEFQKRIMRIESMKEPQAEDTSETKYSVSSLTEKKGSELFRKLERIMQTEYVYRQKDLTRDKLAEILSTNRTYLSQTINEQTGLSVNNYINSYRIDEAVRILSDAENDTHIKAISADLGFNHIQTFYAAFQASVGMPPLKFREKARELHRKNML